MTSSGGGISGQAFDNIYLSLGSSRWTPGIGFQEAGTKNLLTIPANEAHDLIAAHTKSVYGITLDSKDLSYRGYNWGKAEFQGNHMIFNEQPFREARVSLELVNPIPAREPGSKPQRVKEDMLVEIQFYIPGMVTASQVDEAVDGKKLLRDRDSALVTSTANGKSREEGEIQEEDEELVLGDDGEQLRRASIFCETVKNRADVSVSKETLLLGLPICCVLHLVNASASSSTKTFEMRIATQATDCLMLCLYVKEEYENLDAYCRAKKLKVTTDIGDGAPNYAEDDMTMMMLPTRGSERKRTIIQNIGELEMKMRMKVIQHLKSFFSVIPNQDEDYVDKSSDDSDPDLEFDSDAKSDSDADSDEEDDKSKKGKGKAAAKPKDEKKEKKPAAVKKEKDDKSVSSKKKKPAGDDDGPAKKKVKKEDGEAKPKTAASRKKEKEGSPSKEKVKSSEFVDSDDE
ncbi:hypothetical protein BC829DRAFT_445713 [Chytridium lagenaria]|nr:hypothetical protein BC829DRAFT_445713 [Chytridium lagenaria]